MLLSGFEPTTPKEQVYPDYGRLGTFRAVTQSQNTLEEDLVQSSAPANVCGLTRCYSCLVPHASSFFCGLCLRACVCVCVYVLTQSFRPSSLAGNIAFQRGPAHYYPIGMCLNDHISDTSQTHISNTQLLAS
jgi:hypothetical protein